MSKPESRYRTDREYNAVVRLLNRFRKIEVRSISKKDLQSWIALSTELLVDTFTIRMPDDCSWEEYLFGKVDIDHRQSLKAHRDDYGDEDEALKKRHHWSNLWLMASSKNRGKGGRRGDDNNRLWNSDKNRWIETSADDESLIKSCIDMIDASGTKWAGKCKA